LTVGGVDARFANEWAQKKPDVVTTPSRRKNAGQFRCHVRSGRRRVCSAGAASNLRFSSSLKALAEINISCDFLLVSPARCTTIDGVVTD